MATIGTFTHKETSFTGIIRSLTFTASVTIEPVNKRGEKSPGLPRTLPIHRPRRNRRGLEAQGRER